MPDQRDATKCPHHEAIETGIQEIKTQGIAILSELKNGAVKFAEHGKDISLLKKVVFGGIGIISVAAAAGVARLLFQGN